MKKVTLITAAFFAYCILHTAYCFSQGTAINTNGAAADNSALLDLSSTTKGILIPRMTSPERNLISSPAEGLMIFNTLTKCLEMYVNNSWNVISCPSVCLPPSAPGTVSGNVNLCENAAGEVYSIAMVNGATSYNWSVPAGATITSGQGTTSITVTYGSASGNVSVMAGNSCGYSSASNLAVTVTPCQAASVSISANPSGAICSGTNVDFTATAVNGGASPTYQWKLNGGNVGTNSSVYSSSLLANNDQVLCVMTSGLMCVTGSPATSNTITMTVTSAPAAPTAGTHVAGADQIVWNWNTVSGATGYKWHTTNDYNSAQDMLTNTSKTETNLTCGTAYTRYVWAYNNCGYSSATTLTQSTSVCPVWTQFVSDTWAVEPPDGVFTNINNRSSLCYHGIVNTNQLVMSSVYSKSETDVVYYIRGIVFDLTNGTFNIGPETSWGTKGNDFPYKCSVAGDGQYGVTLSNMSTGYGPVQLCGFTITNYSSCNQTTAPTYSFSGSIQHWNNENDGGGLSIDVIATRANNRYIAVSRETGDKQEVRSYIYNGSSFTAEGSVNEISGSNGIFQSLDYFANPGGGLNWGLFINIPDANSNLLKNSKVGSSGYDNTISTYFPSNSSVVTTSTVINDAAGNSQSIVLGERSADAFTTARIATATDFTSGSISLGTAYPSPAKYGMFNLLPYSATKVLLFTKSGANFIACPITISGSVLTWNAAETLSSNNVWSGFNPGAGFRVVYSGVTWYFFYAGYINAKVIAIKYIP